MSGLACQAMLRHQAAQPSQGGCAGCCPARGKLVICSMHGLEHLENVLGTGSAGFGWRLVHALQQGGGSGSKEGREGASAGCVNAKWQQHGCPHHPAAMLLPIPSAQVPTEHARHKGILDSMCQTEHATRWLACSEGPWCRACKPSHSQRRSPALAPPAVPCSAKSSRGRRPTTLSRMPSSTSAA